MRSRDVPDTATDRMVQVGKIESVRGDGRARVYFPETEIISDWLRCVGCSPDVGEIVLVLYEVRPGGRGFILGRVGGAL